MNNIIPIVNTGGISLEDIKAPLCTAIRSLVRANLCGDAELVYIQTYTRTLLTLYLQKVRRFPTEPRVDRVMKVLMAIETPDYDFTPLFNNALTPDTYGAA